MRRGAFDVCSSFVDELTFLVVVLLEKKRGFVDTPPGTPPSFDDVIDEIRERPPEIAWPREFPRKTRMRVDAPALGLEAALDVIPARNGPADTLVVYHHGLGELPHDALGKALRRHGGLRDRCDWVIMRGFHHESFANVSARLTSNRDHFLRCLGNSAAVVRGVANQLRPRYEHLVMCGVSMGGIISMIEASREPRFDLYVPFVAGPNLRDVLTSSVFSRSIQGRALRSARREGWAEEFDLTQRLAECPGPPLRPILARGDALFRVEQQLEAYGQIPRAEVKTFSGGHLTGAVNVPALSRHLRRSIEDVCWTRTPAAVGS